MNSQPNTKNDQTERRVSEGVTTRRAVLAAGGAVALGSLAGCTALEGLIDRGAEELVGTTASSPAAFYPGRAPSDISPQLIGAIGFNEASNVFYSIASMQAVDEPQFFRSGPTTAKRVPLTIQTNGQEFALEGWSIQSTTEAQDYNSVRSNKPGSEWWGGPDDDSDDDGIGDTFVAIQDIELELLGHLVTAMAAVEARDESGANPTLEAFTNASTKALKKGDRLSRCESTVCGTIRENMAAAEERAQSARDAVGDGDWTVAASELAAAEVLVLGDIERLDDELGESRPSRPRFSDLIAYMRDEPTIGERFTVCLPDSTLPGDRGSLAEELTLDRILAYFAPSRESDGVHAPFNDQYGGQGISYDDEGCVQLNGPISLHEDIACQNILSAELDTYTTANRRIVGFSTEGGAVASASTVPVAMDKGLRFSVASVAPGNDGIGEIILGEDRDMQMTESADGTISVTPTLVCPVTVTPADSPCPLPGLFYVRRIHHDDQLIYAGGWVLDEGALYEDSVTLLFDEGPNEIASVTPEDIKTNDYDNRIREQFARDRSEYGSGIIAHDMDDDGDEIPTALQTDEGRKGLNAVNVKVLGEQGDGDTDDDGLSDGEQFRGSVTALDAPLVHLDGRIETGTGNSGEEVDILGMGEEKL
ncbi:hypothetical protein [Haloarchaeobius sp. DYHT-AS-18]|uniref:hypothetical protein n=1 Tax=Haloarchaeobius sp. DYHT-AS-18 TaxID=3446117 RepID=UPI003EBA5CA1